MERNKILIIAGVILVIIFAVVTLSKVVYQEDEFSLKTFLVKLNIPLGGEAVSSVKIVNNRDGEQSFNLRFNNFNGMASLSESEFVLGPKEEKKVDIYFQDGNGEVRIYSGQLIVESDCLTKQVPVVLGVEDLSPAFSIIQKGIPKYDNVYPGGKLGVEIKAYDIMGSSAQSVSAKYYIQNFEDEVFPIDEEDLIIGSSWSKIIEIPESWPQGEYVFVTIIDYQNTKSIAGYLFSVSKKENGVFSGDLKFFVVIILIFVVGVLTLFFYFIKTRDDLLIQLRKQQNVELQRNMDLIKHYEKNVCKEKSPVKRKNKIKKLVEVKKKIIKKIKTRQKTQRKTLEELKKQGKKVEIQKKIKDWQNQGYKMFEAKKELKLSEKDLRNQIVKWKSEGYRY